MANKISDFKIRRKNIFNFILIIFSLIIVKYFHIQILKNDFFQKKSEDISTRLIKTKPPRGFIIDRNGKVIVANRSTFSIQIYPIDYNDSLFDYNLFYDIMNKANKRSNFLIKKESFVDSIKKINLL